MRKRERSGRQPRRKLPRRRTLPRKKLPPTKSPKQVSWKNKPGGEQAEENETPKIVITDGGSAVNDGPV